MSSSSGSTHPQHHYAVAVRWTGNRGRGTDGYRAYGRDHEVSVDGVPVLLASADPQFRGDPERWNPEQLFVAALSQCHLLWYLHLAAEAGVVVTAYEDRATGVLEEEADGAGQFRSVTLHPRVTITDPAQVSLAEDLHHRAGQLCFLARSVRFPVEHEPTVTASRDAGEPAG